MDPIEEAIAAMTDEAKKKAASDAYAALQAKAKQNGGPAGDNQVAAENARLKDQLKRLAEKYPDEEIELSDRPSDPRVNGLLSQLRKDKKAALLKAAEGKIPKGLEQNIIALADILPVSDLIALDDSGAKHSAFEVFGRILDGLPEPVLRGEILLSDPADPAKKGASLSGLMAHV